MLIVRRVANEGPRPTVLWYHGYTADKETNEAELSLLARSDLLAVAIDACGHGQRLSSRLQRAMAAGALPRDDLFYRLVTDTVAEISTTIDALCSLGLTQEHRIGVAGVSMGAHIVYGSVVAEPRVRAAVALLGAPGWPHPQSPHRRLERFFPTALLSITAGADEVVPPEDARDLHHALVPCYRSRPERLQYRELSAEPHTVSPEGWREVTSAMVNWFVRFL